MENLLKDVKKVQIYDITHRIEGKYIENIIKRYYFIESLYSVNHTYEYWYLSIICKIRMIRVLGLRSE